MTFPVDYWSSPVSQLATAINRLEATCLPLRLVSIKDREWYELLTRKLQPQLGQHSFLIVAIVGGTNIGKSVIFNHLAGTSISATSPLASGTKHPTALISEQLAGRIEMQHLFDGFTVEPWKDAQQPLLQDHEHRLFYRTTNHTPENLILLDTPDVDSVEEVNWERADYLRQSADVLIAVLTQQKYNDAAIKEFFRKAAQEDKLIIVIFNQCLLPDDEEYWPLWLTTFCEETGVQPHLLYLAPYDRRAAESNQLKFYERHWPRQPESEAQLTQPHNLLDDLSKLKFEEIKTQALSGALNHLVHPHLGIPGWLREIETASGDFDEALQLMSASRMVEIQSWPTLPNAVFIQQIRQWWRDQRTGWAASVHGFYSQVGQVISYPLKIARQHGRPVAESPVDRYRKQEWEAILDVIERCLERLTWLRDLGNPLLTPRLEKILSGASRADFIAQFREAHAEIDFEKDLAELIEVQLKNFREERPDSYKLFRRMDSLAAAARPGVSLVLFMTGAGPLGEVIAPMLADTALQGVLHVAGETVGGTVVTAVGDKVISDTASSGAGYLEARFRQLHAAFAKQRTDWMIAQLESHLLGALPRELREAARISESPEFLEVSQVVADLREKLSELS